MALSAIELVDTISFGDFVCLHNGVSFVVGKKNVKIAQSISPDPYMECLAYDGYEVSIMSVV